jgi:tetratricopeptide (TPR) repeat protein
MKYLLPYLIASFCAAAICSCHSKMFPRAGMNTESKTASGDVMLLGRCTEDRLKLDPFNSWFVKNYHDYTVDTNTMEKIKAELQQRHFKIFMGTWCGDSRREVPRMFKILDYCGVKSTQIELIMLDNHDSFYKQSPGHEERGLNIHRVPDLIVFEKKTEIGRIIESPVVSLEKDLEKIITGEEYTPNYKAVGYLIHFFQRHHHPNVESDYPDLENKLKPLASGSNELNTYGYVLMAAGEMKKAGIVFEANAKLYPADANVFDSLGEYYLKKGNKSLARENYQKELQIEPGNQAAKKMIVQLQ